MCNSLAQGKHKTKAQIQKCVALFEVDLSFQPFFVALCSSYRVQVKIIEKGYIK